MGGAQWVPKGSSQAPLLWRSSMAAVEALLRPPQRCAGSEGVAFAGPEAATLPPQAKRSGGQGDRCVVMPRGHEVPGKVPVQGRWGTP